MLVTLDARPDYPSALLPGMILTGIGVGLTLPTLVGAAVQALPPHGFATGSAVVTMARQIGAVLGTAILVGIMDAAGGIRAFQHGWWFVIAATAVTVLGCLLLGRAGRTASR